MGDDYYSYDYDENYDEISLVRKFHDLPHLNSDLESQSKEFDIRYEDTWPGNNYTDSLLTVPVICGCIGILLLILLQIYLCISFSNGSPRPNGNRKNSKSQPWCSGKRIFAIIVLVAFTIGALTVSQLPLSGNAELGRGVSHMKDGLDFLQETFDDLESDGEDMVDDGNTVLDEFSSAASSGCPLANNLNEFMEDYLKAADSYLDNVNNVPGEIRLYTKGINRWLVNFKNQWLWPIYAVSMVTIVLMLLGGLFKCNFFTSFGYVLGIPLLLACLIFVTIMFSTLIGVADFCMSPAKHLLYVIKRRNLDVYDYYLTCEGQSPFQEDLDDASFYAQEAENGVNTLLAGPCAGNAALQDARDTINGIQDTIVDVEDLAECDPIQDEALDTLYEGFCKKTFRGVYEIWLGQYLSAAFLLVLILTASLSYCSCCNAPIPPDDDDDDELQESDRSSRRSNGDRTGGGGSNRIEIQLTTVGGSRGSRGQGQNQIDRDNSFFEVDDVHEYSGTVVVADADVVVLGANTSTGKNAEARPSAPPQH